MHSNLSRRRYMKCLCFMSILCVNIDVFLIIITFYHPWIVHTENKKRKYVNRTHFEEWLILLVFTFHKYRKTYGKRNTDRLVDRKRMKIDGDMGSEVTNCIYGDERCLEFKFDALSDGVCVYRFLWVGLMCPLLQIKLNCAFCGC